jgi:hypothetical protein
MEPAAGLAGFCNEERMKNCCLAEHPGFIISRDGDKGTDCLDRDRSIRVDSSFGKVYSFCKN